MTDLENKILEALKSRKADLAKYDADRKAEYDEYMAEAAIQTSEYWKIWKGQQGGRSTFSITDTILSRHGRM